MKIQPPRKKGERAQPVTTASLYQVTVDKIDALAITKNTTRIEYVRWLTECAEAGLVGAIPFGDTPVQDVINNLVDGFIGGHLTPGEVKREVARIVKRECQDTRAAVEAEWAGVNDER